MKSYWLSWYGPVGGFELQWPWWISGYRPVDDQELPDTPTICAAVQAKDEESAKEIVLACHDERPEELEWRFCFERDDKWAPFNDRFPRGAWMKWPDPHLK